jgi:IS5 family transposase
MRRQEQLSLTRPPIDHTHADELDQISRILDHNPGMADRVAQDLVRGLRNPDTGARGMSGDQTLRVLMVKQMNGFSYEELAFHLADSVSYRNFCRFGAFERVPSRATLAENLKKVQPATLEQILQLLVRHALELKVEPGRKIRIDATVTETNIHVPTDSTLLMDGVRVLTRLLGRAEALCGFTLWSDHTKRAKRRVLAIQHTSRAEKRRRAYLDLLKVTAQCMRYAQHAIQALATVTDEAELEASALRTEIEEYRVWIVAVIDQTERRVLQGETVPADEKLLSIFETHTDIIIKDRRETHYGHKIFLGAGQSGLITDCVIASGNPADSTMALPLLERQIRILGKVPRQAAFDGGFASKDNLRKGKALGITDLVFSKKRGLEVSAMTRSSWIFRRLRDFRAGIEGLISFLKRAFGLGRCTWRGAKSFASYVLSSVIAANLLTLARHLLS